MKQYKICVYAICKNEEKNLQEWIEHLKDADKIFVLDTGSTDNSLEILKNNNVIYKQKIYENFRFDVARNDSLDMVDEDSDICICCDIDERFAPNWRSVIEQNWQEDTQMLSYRYTWNFNKDGTEGTVFYISKIHTRHNFRWINPVHEVLKNTSNEVINILKVPDLRLYHYADVKKSRRSYLPLLELAVKENPENDRNMHYLGREYMFYKQYDQAILTLYKHLNLKNATWKDERAASYRYIGRCYLALGNIENARQSFYKAIVEAPYLREPYMEMAFMLYDQKDYLGTLYFIEEALKITNRSYTYINESSSWDSTPYDLASIAAYYLKLKEKALYYVNKALIYSPNNQRIINNKQFYINMD